MNDVKGEAVETITSSKDAVEIFYGKENEEPEQEVIDNIPLNEEDDNNVQENNEEVNNAENNNEEVSIPDFIDPVFMTKNRTIEEAVIEQAKSYSHARKELGRTKQELAELKRTVEEQKEIIELLSGDKDIENNSYSNDKQENVESERVKQLEEKLIELEAKLKQQEIKEKLDEDHFDIVNSEDFAEWAIKRFPMKILAEGKNDPDIASFIVRTYKTEKMNDKLIKKPVFTESAKKVAIKDNNKTIEDIFYGNSKGG